MKKSILHFSAVWLVLVAGGALAGEADWKAHTSAAMAAYRNGDQRAAAASFAAALKAAEDFGESDRRLAATINNLALLYGRQARWMEAEALYGRVLGMDEKALGPHHADVGTTLNNLAELYRSQGRYAEAEPLYRRALDIVEKARGPAHAQGATMSNNLAELYRAQGRHSEAEPLYRRALAIREKAYGTGHLDVGATLSNLADLYRAQGRPAQAEPLYRRSLAIDETTLGPGHPDVAKTLLRLAGFYRVQGREAEAEPLYRRALAIRENALGSGHPGVGEALRGLAKLYQRQRRSADAEPLYKRALSIEQSAFGLDHPAVAATINDLALLYGTQGRFEEALASVRRASAALAGRPGAIGAPRRDAPGGETNGFELHVRLLAAYGERTPQSRGAAIAESFIVAQLARASDTADQSARIAARYATGRDGLARLARSRRDALQRLLRLDSQLAQAVNAAPREGDARAQATLRDEAVDARLALARLDERIERDYSQYGDLTDPKPIELPAVQALLADDEALALVLVLRDESYLWLARRRGAGLFRIALKRGELDAAVRELRTRLERAPQGAASAPGQPFNVALAHQLYLRLFAPAGPLLVDVRHLMLVPDGALSGLPPGVLVTELPARQIATPADHAQVAWLAKRYAITVLPTAGSLRLLRQFAATPSGRDPFRGFGNPLLAGGGAGRPGNPAALFSRGAVADVNEVRRLAPPPDSSAELRAIAATLKAPPATLLLGGAATERAVKEANLARFRNLALATRGLVADASAGGAEPALVLTPPTQGSMLDDGLLTAGEIAQLKLNADWVLLPAIGTAAPDGTPPADGITTLARAFLYAGARSLLVAHWPAHSGAGAPLMTRMLEESAKGTPQSEALRRSMLALMTSADAPQYAHPAYWAPFMVVGEGNDNAEFDAAESGASASKVAAAGGQAPGPAPGARQPRGQRPDRVSAAVSEVEGFLSRILRGDAVSPKPGAGAPAARASSGPTAELQPAPPVALPPPAPMAQEARPSAPTPVKASTEVPSPAAQAPPSLPSETRVQEPPPQAESAPAGDDPVASTIAHVGTLLARFLRGGDGKPSPKTEPGAAAAMTIERQNPDPVPGGPEQSRPSPVTTEAPQPATAAREEPALEQAQEKKENEQGDDPVARAVRQVGVLLAEIFQGDKGDRPAENRAAAAHTGEASGQQLAPQAPAMTGSSLQAPEARGAEPPRQSEQAAEDPLSKAVKNLLALVQESASGETAGKEPASGAALTQDSSGGWVLVNPPPDTADAGQPARAQAAGEDALSKAVGGLVARLRSIMAGGPDRESSPVSSGPDREASANWVHVNPSPEKPEATPQADGEDPFVKAIMGLRDLLNRLLSGQWLEQAAAETDAARAVASDRPSAVQPPEPEKAAQQAHGAAPNDDPVARAIQGVGNFLKRLLSGEDAR